MTGGVRMETLYAVPLVWLPGKVNAPLAVSVWLFAPLLATVMLLPASKPVTVPPTVLVTVKVAALEVTPPDEAVIELLPAPTAVAMPLVLKVETALLLEVQVAELETSPVVASEKVPVAVKVAVVPVRMDAVAGVMLMLVRAALIAVMLVAGEVTPFSEAVIVVAPAATWVTTPVELPTLAIAGAAETQVA